jgi:hypothetical protein
MACRAAGCQHRFSTPIGGDGLPARATPAGRQVSGTGQPSVSLSAALSVPDHLLSGAGKLDDVVEVSVADRLP